MVIVFVLFGCDRCFRIMVNLLLLKCVMLLYGCMVCVKCCVKVCSSVLLMVCLCVLLIILKWLRLISRSVLVDLFICVWFSVVCKCVLKLVWLVRLVRWLVVVSVCRCSFCFLCFVIFSVIECIFVMWFCELNCGR